MADRLLLHARSDPGIRTPEPLTKDQVIAIVRGFIKDDAARGLP